MSDGFEKQDSGKGNSGNYYEDYWKRQARILQTSYINLIIIAINIIVFVYSLFAGEDFISKYDEASDLVVFNHEYYRLITSMFLHGGIKHIGSNLLGLFLLGAYVEYDLGHICYIILYFVSGICGSLFSIGWDFYSMEFIPSIGASGAVYGVIGAVVAIAWFGRKRLRFEGSDLMKRLLIYIVVSLAGGFTEVGIDNAAHVGGLIGGVLITVLMTIILKKTYTMEEWI